MHNADTREWRTEANLGPLRIFLRRRLVESGLRALVVMNEAGELMGCCGEGMDPDRAAALLPGLSGRQVNDVTPTATRLWVDAIPMADQTVYVFSLGNGNHCTVDHEATRLGIRRILEERVV